MPSGHGAERARRIVRVRPTAHSTGSPNGPLSTGSPNGPLSTGSPNGPLSTGSPNGRVRPTAHSTGSLNGPLSTGSPNDPWYWLVRVRPTALSTGPPNQTQPGSATPFLPQRGLRGIAAIKLDLRRRALQTGPWLYQRGLRIPLAAPFFFGQD